MTEVAKEVAKPKGLVTKLSEVMGLVDRVAKNGRNEFHKYDYATESDIVASVRIGMAERHLMLVPSLVSADWRKVQTKNGEASIVAVKVLFTMMDGDSGEKIEFNMMGEGQDAMDKAIYKAVTGAEKYALLKLFMIPTGNDPEADEAPKPAPPPRAAPRQEAARTVRTQPVNLMAAARADRIWKGAQAAGMDRASFGAWVTTVLGAQIASNLWTDPQFKQLEDELTQVTAEAKATQPAEVHKFEKPAPAPAAPPRDSPMVRFGRDKGKTLAQVSDLGWLRTKASEDVAKNDPKWHRKNVEWLTAIDDELQSRSGGHPDPHGNPDADDVPF